MRADQKTTDHFAKIPFAGRLTVWHWLLLLGALLMLGSCYERVIRIDEAWIGEQAYWFAQGGGVRSELFRGFLGAEIQQLVYHKLLVWQGAGLVYLLGWSVNSLRLLSVGYFLTFLGLSNWYLQTLNLRRPVQTRVLFFALLLGNALVTEFSFEYRPELMLMSLGFASWICLEQSHRRPNRIAYAAGAGLLAGLAMLAHLNGSIFVVAGGVLLLRRHHLGLLVAFGTAALAISSLYVLDVLITGSWPQFWQQLQPGLQPAHSGSSGLMRLVLKVLNEHQRLFHSSKEASLSALSLVATALLYRYRATFRDSWLSKMIGYTATLVFSLAVISQNDNSFYAVAYIPFLLLLVVLAADRALTLDRKRIGQPLSLLCITYLLINYSSTVELISHHTDLVSENRALARHIAPFQARRVVAPLSFIFNEVSAFQIQGVFCYYLMVTSKTSTQPDYFFEQAADFRRQLVLLDEEALHTLKLPLPVPGQRFGSYRFSHRFRRFYIYTYEGSLLPASSI